MNTSEMLKHMLPEDEGIHAQVEAHGGKVLAIAQVMNEKTFDGNAWQWDRSLNGMETFRWVSPGNESGQTWNFFGQRETVTFHIAQIPREQAGALTEQGWTLVEGADVPVDPAHFAGNYVRASMNGRGNGGVLMVWKK